MTTATEPQPKPRPKPTINKYSSWLTPRFWHGMGFSTWMRLLAENRFRVALRKVPMTCAITAFSVFNSSLGALQERIYRRKAEKIRVRAPLFIIGHWRSGTTLLHELLVLDRQHTFPTTFQCFAPLHFLLSEKYVRRWLGFVLPDKRPMDNMKTGWGKPQEDEFALCNLGIPSPYVWLAFPNRPHPCPEYLDMQGVSDEDKQRWKDALLWFLKRVTFGDSRRIVLKSPPHTARVKELLEIFPDARFIHIVRSPYDVGPSTVRLWQSLNHTQALQVPRDEGLEEYVLESFERMYRKFDADRELIDPSRFYELRYEDLLADPVGKVQAIYDHLELGDFEPVRPEIEAYFEGAKDYRRNEHQMPPDFRDQITRRWASYIERYGYTEPANDDDQ